MPLFVMIGKNGPDAVAKRGAVRPRHLEHLKALDRDGRIALAGPLLEEDGATPCGSLVVLEAESYEAARAVVEADPYVTDGVFASYDLRAFTKVLPGADE